MDENYLKNELLSDLDPKQAEAVMALYNRLKGKKPNEMLPIAMSFKMPQGRPISPEKRQKLIAAVMEMLNVGQI